MNITLPPDCCDLRGCSGEGRRKFPSSFWDGGLAKYRFEIGSVCPWHPAISISLAHLTVLYLGHQEPALCSVHAARILYSDLSFLIPRVSSSKYTYLTFPPRHPYPMSIPQDNCCQQGQKEGHLIIHSQQWLTVHHLPGQNPFQRYLKF